MRWEYKNESIDDLNEDIQTISNEDFITSLLSNRGFSNENEAKKFIFPSLNDFNDPFDFEKMDKAASVILDKIKNKEKIFVYGDYDVDGITAAAFLYIVLKKIGADIEYYIPKRTDVNYGLDRDTIDVLKAKGGKLIVTVDTGYNDIKDLEYAKTLGIDTVITDHHKITKETDDENVLLLNPKLSNTYKFKYLSGAGMALKLAQGIYKKDNRTLDFLNDYMDIVMIGTVADVVPMIDENRIIIKEGLKKLKQTKVKGLMYLLKYLKLQDKDISTTDISYFISPLINSLGRIGNSKMGADFFVEEDDFIIYNIIEEMKRTNRTRRDLERKIYEESVEKVKKEHIDKLNSIFLSSEKWHPGVIGVVSSRLSIKYNVPVTLVSLKNGIGKASCRSIKGISIFDIFDNMKNKFIRFGGHDLASGFIVEEDKLKEISENFQDSVKNVSSQKEEKTLKIDGIFPLEYINDNVLDDLKKIAPFGLGNSYPLFLDRDVKIKNIKKFGVGERHFNGFLEKKGKTYNMVGFELGYKVDKLNLNNKNIDIVYYPEKVLYKGEKILQIRLKDLRLSN